MSEGRQARERILAQLRTTSISVPPLPAPLLAAASPGSSGGEELRMAFERNLAAAGGRLRVPTSGAAHSISALLAELGRHVGARRLASFVAGLPGPFALEGCTAVDVSIGRDPHQFDDVDLAVVPGLFAVAENGAVWVDGRNLNQRTLCFTAQHLVLLVPADQMVSDMHAAYERLHLGAVPFGVFISGPSKTADIEQALVLGAHGPRSLTVILV